MKLGILGGGQLGRMMALAAAPLGVRCTVLDPAPDPCAAQVCEHIQGEYDDYRALYQLVKHADVITYEFENVPVAAAEWLAQRRPVHPKPRALEVSQERVAEKRFFQSLGIPTAPFHEVSDRASFDAALAEIALPAVLKTRQFGYDGKGQMLIRTPEDAEIAWQTLGGRPLILEGFVPFDRELSIIAVRSAAGETAFYPLAENEHREGMLHRSLAPAERLGEELSERAAEFASRVLTELDYAGVLAIEFFQEGPRLIANEMAPRVHNSGHWTLNGAVTSQFENHVRAVLGLPLGSTRATGHCAMLNLIGTHPPFADILAIPEARLHWYGKEPRPRRKIGHVNLCAASADECARLLRELESL